MINDLMGYAAVILEDIEVLRAGDLGDLFGHGLWLLASDSNLNKPAS